MARSFVLVNGQKVTTYNNNPKLKAAHNRLQFTQEQMEEYIRCATDVVYFCENYVKVVSLDEGIVPFKMWDFQKKMVESYSKNRFNITMCPRQVGKALDITTPILTTSGWKTMEDLLVGDYVYGDDGKPTKITAISPIQHNRVCYDMKFDSGEVIRCDAEHLWTVECNDWNNKKTLTTQEIVDILKFSNKRKDPKSIRIRTQSAIDFTEKYVPIDPYTLGLWLGDGTSRTAEVTCHKDDYPTYKHTIPYEVGEHRCGKNFTIHGLYPLLRTSGLLQNKHIPDDYIYNTKETRIALLQGLMDSDGYCRENGGCEFSNKNREIIDGLCKILSTLGTKHKVSSKQIKGQTYYTIKFCTNQFECFRLERKLSRQKSVVGHKKLNNYYIKEIVPTESVPVKCIAVDNKSKLYLAGKSMIPTHNSVTVICGYILHELLFKDQQNWAILANKGALARDQLEKLQLSYEQLPMWLQQGVITWNKGSILLENGSKVIAAATSASAVRGNSYNGILLDEFAHVQTNLQEKFFNSTYPTLASGKTTKMIIISTPLGMNLFYKLWKDAVEKKNEYSALRVHWWEVPGRDEEYKRVTIANTSQRQWDQEQECEFLGSEETLISGIKLRSLVYSNPIIDDSAGLKIYENPKEKHSYVATVDTSEGIGGDACAISIFDITEIPYRQVATYKNNTVSVFVFPTILCQLATKYNEAIVLVETMSTGKQVVDILRLDLEYENIVMIDSNQKKGQNIGGGFKKTATFGLKTNKATKTIGCMNLKTLIEQDKLLICDFDTVQELYSFVLRNGQYKAEEGRNDDLAMTLVLFAWMTAQKYFTDLTDMSVRDSILEEFNASHYEELTPIGIFTNGKEIEGFVDSDGQYWQHCGDMA